MILIDWPFWFILPEESQDLPGRDELEGVAKELLAPLPKLPVDSLLVRTVLVGSQAFPGNPRPG